MRVPEGDYIVRLFDKYGQHLKGQDFLAGCYMEAVKAGWTEVLAEKGVRSFNVLRHVYQSLDHEWDKQYYAERFGISVKTEQGNDEQEGELWAAGAPSRNAGCIGIPQMG